MKTTRTLLSIAAAVLSTLMIGAPASSRPAEQTRSVEALAGTNPLHAARLRKLHLVRPDLINYPLSLEVVC